MPFKVINPLTREYKINSNGNSVGHYHNKLNYIIVQREGDRLSISCGGHPLGSRKLDGYVRDFINTLFANRSVSRLVLGRQGFEIEITEYNSWSQVESLATELADKMYLANPKNEQFIDEQRVLSAVRQTPRPLELPVA